MRRLIFTLSLQYPSKASTVSSPFLAAHQPEKPKVSVVITTYNRSAIVPIAIESVLRQSYADYELIVIDDGSTDDTRERLQAYGANIRYFYQANRGVSAARNTGVGVARGEWVSILDSDDVWDPTKLERQLEVLAALGNEYGACITNCKYVGDPAWSATVFQENGLKTDSMSGPLNDPMKYILKNGYGTCVQSLLVLRSVIDKAGGFDEALGLAEDRDLMFRLTFRTRFCYVSAPLVSIDRTPRVSRLTDLCSKRDDYICAWGELLRKKCSPIRNLWIPVNAD